jgi:hypothetical protein
VDKQATISKLNRSFPSVFSIENCLSGWQDAAMRVLPLHRRGMQDGDISL